MNPTPGSVFIDPLLTNFSLALMQKPGSFVAPLAFPVIPVSLQAGKYAVYPRGYFMRGTMKVRPLGDRPIQIDYKIDYGSFYTDEYAAEKLVDDRVRANSMDPLGPDRGATKLLTSNALVFRDRHWADTYFKAGVWTSNYAGVAAAPGVGQFLRFDQAGSDPLGYIESLKESMGSATGFEPNIIVLGRLVYGVLKEHPQVLDRIKYSQRGVVTVDLLAELFGVDKVVVAMSVQTTSAEGQTDTTGYIADPKSFWLGYATSTPNLEEPTAGATFAWTGLIPGLTNALGGVVERGRAEREHSDWFHIRQAFGDAVVAPDLGIFAASAVS